MKKLSLPIIIAPDINENGLFGWFMDSVFYKVIESRTFYLYFPQSAVSIQQVKFKTMTEVYPDDFSIYVSHDNQTWKNIIKNKALCDENTRQPLQTKSLACKPGLIRSFDAVKVEGFFSYLKFEMNTNTYYEGNYDWVNLVAFKGMELFGKLLTEYKCSMKYHNKQHALFVYFI